MNEKIEKVEARSSREAFSKIFDDAGKVLTKDGTLEFLNELPDQDEEHAQVPFPYGTQTGEASGWK
ncbi:MAG: hypothetical protein KDJ19_07555 [Hyphomicrobiaceae bacterium]|nr:hypothetical protein [Hyphomicrobiaceae bacterium]MCC0024726.1 hypothetical protein [Hyphomicrobiaceae bacterium]